MAFWQKETDAARPKRAADGAVSARYTKKRQQETTKPPAKTAGRKTEKAQDKAPDKKADGKPERKTAGKTAAQTGAPKRKAGTGDAARRTQKNAESAAVRRTKRADNPENRPEKAAAGTAAAAKRQTAQKQPAVRRAKMADAKTIERAQARERREPGRIRRERKRTEAAMRDRRRAVSRGVDMKTALIVLMTTMFIAGGLLLSWVRSPQDMRPLYLIALLAPLCVLTTLALPRVLPVDPLIMALTNFLCGVGIVVLYTVSPERGARQATFYVLGLASMLVVSLMVSRGRRFRGLTALLMLLGIGALILPLAFGTWNNGAKNWVSIPVFGSFQPSELVKISLVMAMAYYFSAHRTVLQMMPAILFAGACLLLLMLQRDLGTALIYYATTLVMFYVACGNVPLTVIGLGGGAGAAMLGYEMFAHVKVRVAMWRNPWSDPLDKGYQIIQALLAIGSGGLTGVGLGQGTPQKIPAYYNDFIFAVVCEQLGIVFGVALLAVYVMLILRGVTVINRSRRSFDMLLGCGVLAMLAIQTFMIVGGVIKMLPLTGVTMPFLSYGGSSLLSCLSMIGILHGISARAQEDLEEDVLSPVD